MNTNIVSQQAALLDRIFRQIRQQPTDGNVSLLSGQMGFVMLETYAQRFFGETDDRRIWERITNSLTAVQNGQLLPSFANGMTGVLWGFLHLCNQGILFTDGLDAQNLVADLDEPIFELSMELLRKGKYDYLHGGLGCALYFLERQPSPALTRYMEEIVSTLAETAVHYPNGDLTWTFDDLGRQKTGQPIQYNPGLSHGTASIAALLSLFYERGYARAQCAPLIQGTLQWIWNNRNRSGQTVFPTVVTEPRQDQNSRLGWCYGDLSIAHTFWLAGRILRNTWWRLIAQETLLRTAQRRIPEETSITDAGICHGASGVAHLFRSVSRQAPDPILTETADYWMQQTIRMATPESNESIFSSDPVDSQESDLGLLEGACSVGMVLLSELGVPSIWNRFLLLS